MKPGDLVITVDPDCELEESHVGLCGIIIEQVTLDDGHPINSWCDWWVLVDGEMWPWSERNLEVIDERR